MHTYLITPIFSTSLIDRQLLSFNFYTIQKKPSLSLQAFPPLLSRTSPRILVAPFPFAKETSQQSRLFPPPSRDLERQQKKQLSGTIYHRQRDPLDILRRNASKNPPSLLATRCTAEYVESFAMRRIICRTPRFSDCISPGLIPRAGHFGPLCLSGGGALQPDLAALTSFGPPPARNLEM